MNKDQLYARFDKYDSDGDGLITRAELKNLLNSLGYPATDAQIQDLMNYAEITSDGKITGEGFKKIYDIQSSEGDTQEDLEEAFKIFDKDNTGYLTTEKILAIFKKVDENIQEEEILQLIKENDLDGDGQLNFDEFCNMVKNK